MSIITFYSYKGGVGRSMAVANVAVLLARQGCRVLVVDWDLEAPGIEKYFADLRISQTGIGLLPLLLEVAKGNQPHYREYTWTVATLDDTLKFSFLHAGREADPEYFERLEHFDWAIFFRRGGGDFLERLREQWLAEFDLVLIDSRTGLSDSGGVCTIQLPDIIVALFTPAHQSLFGVRDVMRLAQAARHRLAYDRDALSVVPVPSRVDREQRSFADWIRQFAVELNEFFGDWLPKQADRLEVLKRLAIDHCPGVFHGERLAVHPTSDDTAALANSYSTLATLLATDLRDVSPTVTGVASTAQRRPRRRTKRTVEKGPHRLHRPDYEYDVYISYPRTEMVTRWIVDHLLPLLLGYLEIEMGRASIFLDKAELALADEWAATQVRALKRSRMMLAIWSPAYFRSRWCLAEFETFRRRAELVGEPLFVPVVIHSAEFFPETAKQYHWLDMRGSMILGEAFKKSKRYIAFEESVRQLGLRLGLMSRKVPPLNPEWPIIQPMDLEIPEAALPRLPRLE